MGSSRLRSVGVGLLLSAEAAAAVGALIAPPAGFGRPAFICSQALILILVAVGVRRTGSRPVGPWPLLALGLATAAVAGVAWAWTWDASPTRSVGPIDAMFLVAYLPLVAGLLVLLRESRARRDVEGIIDGSIFGAALAVVCWQLVLAHGGSISGDTSSRLVIAAYPVLDVVLLVMAAHLAVSRGRRAPWIVFLLGTGLLVIADFARAVALTDASARTMWQVQVARSLGLVVLAAAVAHPARFLKGEAAARSETPPVRVRAALLLLPLLVGPCVLLLRGKNLDNNARAVIVLSLLLGSIVIARLAKLGHEVSGARQRERANHLWFESLVRNAKDSILVLDAEGRITWLSPAVHGLLGYPTASLRGQQILKFVHAEDRTEVSERLARLVAQPDTSGQIHVRVRDHQGRWRRLEAHAVNLLDDPTVAGIVVNQRDVTEWFETDSAVRSRAAQQEAVAALSQRALEGAEPAVLATQAVAIVRDNLEVSACQFFRVQTGRDGLLLDAVSTESGVAAGIAGTLSLPSEPGTFGGFALSSPSPVICGERDHEERFELPTDAGSVSFAATMSAAVIGRHAPHGILAARSVESRAFSADDALFVQAVANALALALERRQAEDETRRQALHDTLTGLPNRALFLDRLHHALSRTQRTHSALAVLFLDLDHFKVVNDSLGHDAGDRLLVAVAHRLSGVLRPGDTVARFGGDEFTVLCESIAGTHEAIEIAERINTLLAEPLRVGPAELHTTASIGIAVTTGRATRPESLLRDADAAMYRAKDGGRARYELFDATMRDRAVSRLRTESSLRQAVAKDELELHYQPVIDLRTGRTIGAEALCRWNHPDRGLVLPAEFIPIAEETGLIDAVGDWVLDTACRQASIWSASELGQDLMVSVNVSARALGNPQFVHDVRARLEENSLDPSLLCLEITESVLMGNVELSLASLTRLKELGVAVAIDDFGTGYSSLAYLKRFPVDILKVDRSFVSGLGEHSEDTAIVETVVTLASTLGLMAIAEGVETEGQLSELTTLGCDMAQGYLFSTPRTVEDFEQRLASEAATVILPDDRRRAAARHPSSRPPAGDPRVGLQPAASELLAPDGTIRLY